MEFSGLKVTAQSQELLDTAARGLEECQQADDEADTGASPISLSTSTFDTALFTGALSTQAVGRVLLAAGSMPSTQSFLQQHGHLLPDGAVLVADQQVSGKGRGGNSWVSPVGCLMFSLCKKVTVPGAMLPFMQYVVALSVVEAAANVASAAIEGSELNMRIKWPNDLYIAEHKVGGVLCNSTYRDGSFLVVVGVGINVSNRKPTTCLNAELLTGQAAPGEPPSDHITVEETLAEILNRLERNLEDFEANGFGPMEERYLDRWLHSQQEVILEEDDPGFGKSQVSLTIQGLTSAGFLLGVDRYGGRFELHPDGNSFDFMQGLVRKKL